MIKILVILTEKRLSGKIDVRSNRGARFKTTLTMEKYTFTDVQKRQEEVFNKAAIEPVLLTERSRPSHVIMSAETYQQLMEKLAELEDAIWGKAAETALKNSKMVGSEKFTETLKKLA